MAARKKAAKVTWKAADFDAARLALTLTPPITPSGAYAWRVAQIREARDAQLRGQFCLAAQMARAQRTDDALFVARQNRLAPQKAIGVEIVPAKGARGKSIAAEAEALFGQGGICVTSDVLSDIHGCLVDHGIAFATVTWTARDDGSRVDPELHYWSIEHVRWDPVRRCYLTRIDPKSADAADPLPPDDAGYGFGSEIPIVEGTGRWIIFAGHEHEPFAQEACLLSSAMIWARHAFAVRDWAKGSTAHGNAKVVGEMPEGMAIDSDEGRALLELIRVCASEDTPYGIKPKGSTLDFITNSSNAWQVWAELIENAEKAAARVYLGTDGTLGAQGGAPGIDITQLFGVATTLVQGDLAIITRGLQRGLIGPWCAQNFGTSDLAPTRRYMMPDADADAARKSLSERLTAFFDALDRAEKRFTVDQGYVDQLAKDYDVTPPMLKLAPTSIAVAPAAVPALRSA